MSAWARLRSWSPYPEIILVAIVALVVPLLLSELTFYMTLLLSAIVVTGLSLFMGYAGQAALGQGAFVAVGALTVGVFTVQWHLRPGSASSAHPCSPDSSRRSSAGPSCAFAATTSPSARSPCSCSSRPSWASCRSSAVASGSTASPRSSTCRSDDAQTRNSVLKLIYVVLAVIILMAAILVSHRVVASRFGRGIRALSGSESAAASAGVPVLGSKLKVFVLAAVFAGLAGALTAFYFPFVTPSPSPRSSPSSTSSWRSSVASGRSGAVCSARSSSASSSNCSTRSRACRTCLPSSGRRCSTRDMA